jgi:hypothetical protein
VADNIQEAPSEPKHAWMEVVSLGEYIQQFTNILESCSWEEIVMAARATWTCILE